MDQEQENFDKLYYPFFELNLIRCFSIGISIGKRDIVLDILFFRITIKLSTKCEQLFGFNNYWRKW